MEAEPQTSAVSEAETTLKKENVSEVAMEQPQTPTKSADPPASDPTPDAGSESQLQLFVNLLTVRVMAKCHAVQNCTQEAWMSHTKRLVNQTMEGLSGTEGFGLDVKRTKKVCKAVLKDLQKKLGGKRLLSLILLQDPDVDAAIVQSLQTHIKELSDKWAKMDFSHRWWKDVLKVLAFGLGLLAAFFLIALVP